MAEIICCVRKLHLMLLHLLCSKTFILGPQPLILVARESVILQSDLYGKSEEQTIGKVRKKNMFF